MPTAARGLQRRGADRARGRRGLRARFGVYIHNIYGLTETTSPSHAVPFGTRAPVDPALRRPVGRQAGLRDRLPDRRRGGRGGAGGRAGGDRHRRPAGRAGLLERRRGGRDAVSHRRRRFVDAGGWFFVVDRKKDQINAAGYKVWPREVEDVLYEHPAVSEVAVVGVPDDYRGETVKAFVVLRGAGHARGADRVRRASGWPPTSARGRSRSSTSCRRRRPARSSAAPCETHPRPEA